ncbi:IPIL1 protein, partial [Turnix velox]|nr:IPIL1 protein [Turnix velox]
RRRLVEELVDQLLTVIRDQVSKKSLPVPQAAVGVGSAFEEWSHQDEDEVFQLLVPLKPPAGFAFEVAMGD